MRSLPIALTFACVLVAVCAAGGTALAEPRADRPNAGALKRKGDAEMDLLHYAEALASYTEAYELTHDPALRYNRARVLEALERFAEALDQLDRFAAEASPELRARVPRLRELVIDLGARVTKLTINCGVPNARVIVRNKVVATTPVTAPIRINAGVAELEVVADGYAPYIRTIELPKAGALTVDVTLDPREAKGLLAVASTPDGAEIEIDGAPFGHAPTEAQLAPGNHVVVASLSGHRDKKVSAIVVESERRRVEITLEAKPPVTRTWWFWTAIGVVAVGAAVATAVYALTTERSADHGDIPPGQVAGPLRF